MSAEKRGFKFVFPKEENADGTSEADQRFQPFSAQFQDTVTIRIPPEKKDSLCRSRRKRHTRTKSVTIRFRPCYDNLRPSSEPPAKTIEVLPYPCDGADESSVGDSEDFHTTNSPKDCSCSDNQEHTECPAAAGRSDAATHFSNLMDCECQTSPPTSRASSSCSGSECSTVFHDMAQTDIITLPSETDKPVLPLPPCGPLESSEFVPCRDTDTDTEQDSQIFEVTSLPVVPQPKPPVPRKSCGCFGIKPKPLEKTTESLEYLPNEEIIDDDPEEESDFRKLSYTSKSAEFLLRENSSSDKNISTATPSTLSSSDTAESDSPQPQFKSEEIEPSGRQNPGTSGALLRDAIMAECCVCSEDLMKKTGIQSSNFETNAKTCSEPLEPCLNNTEFLESLNYRLRKAIHYDTKIVCGDHEYACHSIALQAYSKYFDRLRRPKETIHRIELPPEIIATQDFPILMDWILQADNSKYSVITRANVLSLYATACCLQIPGLVQQCVHFINERLQNSDHKNLLQLYTEACSKPNCNQLRAPIAAKLVLSFTNVYKTSKFLDLGADELIALIEADDVRIDNELQIFDTAIRWLLHDWPARCPNTARILNCVRFGLMTPLELTQLQHCPNLTQVDEFHQIMADPRVKAMVDQGLTYAIYHENYKTNPRDFNKWLECSKVQAPRPRTNLSNTKLQNDGSCGSDLTTSDSNIFYDTKSPPEYISSSHKVQRMEDVAFEKLVSDRQQQPLLPLDLAQQQQYHSPEFLKALVKAQALVRGHLARKRYKELRKALRNQSPATSAPSFGASPNSPSLLLPGQENILVFGGMNPKKPFDLHNNNSQNIYRYNFKQNLWRLKGRLPSPRSHCGIVHLQGLIYLFGGHDPTKSKTCPGGLCALSTCIALDPTTGVWHRDLPNMKEPRTNFAWTVYRNKVYVFGGKNSTGALASCEVFAVSSKGPNYGSWTPTKPMPEPCISSTAVKAGSEIYLIGGITHTKTAKNLISKRVWVYKPETDSWSQGPPMVHGRCFAQAVSHYDKVYLLSGVGRVSGEALNGPTCSLNEVAELDLRSMKWTVTDRTHVPRHGHSVAQVGKHVVIIGGASSKTMQPLDSVELYNLSFQGSSRLLAPLPEPLNGMAVIKI